MKKKKVKKITKVYIIWFLYATFMTGILLDMLLNNYKYTTIWKYNERASFFVIVICYLFMFIYPCLASYYEKQYEDLLETLYKDDNKEEKSM